MDDVFETVNGGDFAVATFVRAAGYGHFVVFADGDGADLIGGGVSYCGRTSTHSEAYVVFFS